MRSKCILAAAIVLLVSTAGLFGQGATMATIPQNNVGANVHTGSTGTIIVNNPTAGALGTAASVIDLTFDLVITNGAAAGVITGVTAISGALGALVVSPLGTNSARITLGAAFPAADSITVTGLLVDAAAATSFPQVVRLSSNNIPVVAGQDVATVIVLASAEMVVNTTPAPAGCGGSYAAVVIVATGGAGTTCGSPEENVVFPAAFTAQADATAIANANIDFQVDIGVTGIPAGATVVMSDNGTGNLTSLDLDASTGAVETAFTFTNTVTSVTGVFSFAGGVLGAGLTAGPAVQDIINLAFTVTAPAASGPFSAATVIAWTANISPVQAALTGTSFPRYQLATVGPTTLATFTPAISTLLFPATRSVSGGAVVDTGFVISNTSVDSGAGALVGNGGTVIFDVFPNDGAPVIAAYTTVGGDPGTGTDGTGNVVAGGAYIVLFSEILTAAGITGDFDGYVIVRTNFTNAHAIAFQFTSTNLSQSYLALVLPNAARVQIVETLGH